MTVLTTSVPSTKQTSVAAPPAGTASSSKRPTSGQCCPLGATVVAGGVNFSVYSRDATSIDVLLFDRADDARPAAIIPIDPATSRTYHYWHTFVPGLKAGQIYGYRVAGPFEPERGMRFDDTKVLLDP